MSNKLVNREKSCKKRGWISHGVDDKIPITDIPHDLLNSEPINICIFRDSSAVEQEAVNFKVLGSNPSRGAQ